MNIHVYVEQLATQGRGTLARAVDYLPTPIQRGLVKLLPYPYAYPSLDPTLSCMLALQYAQGQRGFLSGDLKQSRQAFEQQMQLLVCKPTFIPHVQDLRLPLPSGTIAARHYHPQPKKKLPMLVFYHGGGFISGSISTHDEACRLFAKSLNMQIISVQYPLAPEASPKQLIQACNEALQWVYYNRRQLNIYKGRIAIAGDSAGGNICAVLAQQTIGQAYAPQAQWLIYPALDFKQHYPSADTYAHGLVLTAEDVQQVKTLYAQRHQMELDDPLISPIYADVSAQLPPACIVTVGHDILHDEAELYAQKLKAQGCRVQYLNYTEQTHGFINLTTVSKQAKKRSIEMALNFKKFWRQCR